MAAIGPLPAQFAANDNARLIASDFWIDLISDLDPAVAGEFTRIESG
jgi:hypothetical protein